MSEFDPNIPIYVQIMNTIKQNLVTGNLKPGDKLTSVRELAEKLSVNPNTVQRAYQELEREGVSETRRGMGSFVVERETLISALKTEMAKALMKNFIYGMKSLGYSDDEMLKTIGGELAAGRN
jgi:DNA-binding transcriptional regulator YhcF (GntR family)